MVKEQTLKMQAAYQKKHYKQVAIRWPIDFVERLNRVVSDSEYSLAAYVRNAIEEQMKRDGVEIPEAVNPTEDEE